MFKKGDTLIEVTLAVGIFSMIAIAITAVMSSGTSGAQTALETTLTREEIDTQADTLRFIQTAYAVNKNNTENNKIYELWHKITDTGTSQSNAIDLGDMSDEVKETILQYSPSSCADLYNQTTNGLILDHAFVINPRQLGNYINGRTDIDSVYIDSNSNRLTVASVYPRLVYGQNEREASDSTQDLVSSPGDNLYRAEGIYVIAVKDDGTTKTINEFGSGSSSSFYDFYIRTCWYGTDANQPSTISTVIRLHDPDSVK